MVMMAADGLSVSEIARRVGTCRARVGQWVRQFEGHRLAGLEDMPRSGRPVEISPLERHQVIATACRAPADFGFQRVLWSHATLAIAVMSSVLTEKSASGYFFHVDQLNRAAGHNPGFMVC
jgi:transposase